VSKFKKIVRWSKRAFIGILLLYLIFEVCLFFTILPFDELENHAKGFAIFDNKNELIGMYTNIQGDYFIPYSEVTPIIKNGLMAVEDQRFLFHCGVDFIAILRACKQNIFARKRVSGASTISMQLIRLKLNNNRIWFAKLKEAWLALKIEREYSKDQILLAYLNNAPFGGNIYGIETASLYYFSKRVNELNVDEMALLLGLPQSPTRFRPDRNFDKANNRKMFILQRMYEEKILTKIEYHQYKGQTTTLKLQRNTIENQTVPLFIKKREQQGIIFSSIDSTLQSAIHGIMVGYLNQFGLDSDCAITVIEMPSGQVRAVSETNHNDKSMFVSSALSPRSTGSCLKPFIYCQAFETGMAWPDLVVSDSPSSFNGYNPRNNDRQYINRIAIRDALKLSRNIPAVELLNKMGLKKFDKLLNDLNLKTNHEINRAGLTSALGGLSFNLLELTNAYGVFARDGAFKPYSFLSNPCIDKPISVFSASSISQLKECLIYHDELHFYAKTGTSWGPRDAWCIGYHKKFCVGVWVGKKNGGSLNGVTGELTAFPLLCQIFSLLNASEVESKIESEIVESSEVYICSRSGFRASRFCSEVSRKINNGVFLQPICSGHQDVDEVLNIKKEFKISKPEKNAKYLLISGNKDITIECKANDSETPIYWFVNGVFSSYSVHQYLGSDQVKPGENVVFSVNNSGQWDIVKIMVEIMQ